MAKTYVFYNPLAGQGKILEDLEVLEFVLDTDCVFCDMTRPETYGEDLFAMAPEDVLVICGGDGTLNRFVNLVDGIRLENQIYYYPAGEHNDFALDYGRCWGDNPFAVTKVLKALPKVRTGSKTGMFLTGIVHSCMGRRQKGSSVKLTAGRALYHFEALRFLAILQGRHCCGGMIPDPTRQRTDRTLSCVLIHGCGRLKARYLLSCLQRGRIPDSRHFTVLKDTDFRLTFDRPVTLLTDGEVQTGVTELDAWREEVQP